MKFKEGQKVRILPSLKKIIKEESFNCLMSNGINKIYTVDNLILNEDKDSDFDMVPLKGVNFLIPSFCLQLVNTLYYKQVVLNNSSSLIDYFFLEDKDTYKDFKKYFVRNFGKSSIRVNELIKKIEKEDYTEKLKNKWINWLKENCKCNTSSKKEVFVEDIDTENNIYIAYVNVSSIKGYYKYIESLNTNIIGFQKIDNSDHWALSSSSNLSKQEKINLFKELLSFSYKQSSIYESTFVKIYEFDNFKQFIEFYNNIKGE